jgi:CheY-like chemotaxis protein
MPSETILLVEDNAQTRDVVRRTLETAGYAVIPAETPKEAIDLVSNPQDLIHALVTDIGLLGVTGPQLARLIVVDRPGLRVLYI